MSLKVFTPLEATKTLPLVRQIVGDVLAQGQSLLALRGEPMGAPERARAERLVESLDGLFRELEQIGCSFRCPNFERGIVDFPGLIEGELVHLCWRDDEPELAYYHPPDAGFAGRKPIPAELLREPKRDPSSETQPSEATS